METKDDKKEAEVPKYTVEEIDAKVNLLMVNADIKQTNKQRKKTQKLWLDENLLMFLIFNIEKITKNSDFQNIGFLHHVGGLVINSS